MSISRLRPMMIIMMNITLRNNEKGYVNTHMIIVMMTMILVLTTMMIILVVMMMMLTTDRRDEGVVQSVAGR